MAPIITFIGGHDQERSDLVGRVINHLMSFGYKVAAIKSADETGPGFGDMVGPGRKERDSAGADDVLAITPDRMILQTKNVQLPLSTLAHRYFPDVDIVVGEGFATARRVAKIEVVHDKHQMLRKEVHGVIALASDLDIDGERVFRLHEAKEIAAFLQQKFLADKEPSAMVVSLLLNGKRVPLKKFVQEALAGTVVGFINSLKLADSTSEIDLRIQLGPVNKVSPS